MTGQLGKGLLGSFELGKVGADLGLEQHVYDTLVLSQSVVCSAKNAVASNVLALNQTVHISGYGKHIDQSLAFTQNVAPVFFYHRSLTTNIIFNEILTYEKIVTAHNSLTFAESVSVEKTMGVSNVLPLTETLVSQYTLHNEVISNTLPLVQTLVVAHYRSLSLSDTLDLDQTVGFFRIKALSVENTLNLHQEATGAKIFKPADSLILDHSVSFSMIKNRSLISTLDLDQQFAYSAILTFDLTDTLVFQNAHIDQFLPDYLIPNLQITKTQNYIKLEVPERVIILPKPEFDDSEGLTDEINKKRSINGNLFTYIRRNLNRKLDYSIKMDRTKAWELRDYINQFLVKRMKLTNWKGEIWVGFIMNNPFDLNAESRGGQCGERYAAKIEFEGFRVH